MSSLYSLNRKIDSNYEGLIKNLRRQGTPDRVYNLELMIDREIEDIIDKRFSITSDLNANSADFEYKRRIAIQRFLGYDYVDITLLNLTPNVWNKTQDTTSGEQGKKDRMWLEEHKGRISTWEEFEKYPWPALMESSLKSLEWYDKNLPDDMCLVAKGGGFCEYLTWLMGYESLCYALYEDRELVKAISAKILEHEEAACKVALQSSRVKIFCGDDDMGHKTGTTLSPADLKEFVLSGHKRLAELTHDAGKTYIMHSCGNRKKIIDELIDYVKLDGIHSWEDTIEYITDAKRIYGNRISLLGGMDINFLCISPEKEIRKRVRETIEVCMPGGGFCLGTGNSVANYIPVDNYLIMLDEGRRYI